MGTFEHPRRPQRPVRIEQPAIREVLIRHASDFQRTQVQRLPPVEFVHLGQPLAQQVLAHPQAIENLQVGKFDLQPLEGVDIEVVVVVVADHYRVNRRKVFELDPRRTNPMRADERGRGQGPGFSGLALRPAIDRRGPCALRYGARA